MGRLSSRLKGEGHGCLESKTWLSACFPHLQASKGKRAVTRALLMPDVTVQLEQGEG